MNQELIISSYGNMLNDVTWIQNSYTLKNSSNKQNIWTIFHMNIHINIHYMDSNPCEKADLHLQINVRFITKLTDSAGSTTVCKCKKSNKKILLSKPFIPPIRLQSNMNINISMCVMLINGKSSIRSGVCF